jgi:hypothetical protein
MSLAETKLIVSGITCFHSYYVERFITKSDIEGNSLPLLGHKILYVLADPCLNQEGWQP